MSELYEGFIIVGTDAAVRNALANVRCTRTLRLVRLALEVFGIYPPITREQVFDEINMGKVGEQLSVTLGRTLLVYYDNRCGFRAALLFVSGQFATRFGEEDETWLPLDQNGDPIRDGPTFRLNELSEDEEYECAHSAIDAGLAAIGVASQVSCEMLKDAFCYETFGWDSEKSPAFQKGNQTV